MGKKSATPANVEAAAETEGEFSQEIALNQLYADRANQTNALGSSTWSQSQGIDPSTGKPITKWENTQTLDPRLQSVFNSDMKRNASLGNQANSMTGRIKEELGQPLNYEQFGQGQAGPSAITAEEQMSGRSRAEDAAYGRSTQRLDPQFEKQRATLERQMAGRGLRAGDSAYDSAMGTFNTGRNDAYEMARMGATSEGRAENAQFMNDNQQRFDQGTQATNQANALRNQNIQEYLGKRTRSLDESNALKAAQTTNDTIAAFGGG